MTTAKPAGEPRPRWSVGSDNFDVYRDRKLFASCATQANAAEIVAALNAAETRAAQPPTLTHLIEELAEPPANCSPESLRSYMHDVLRHHLVEAAAQPGDAPKLTALSAWWRSKAFDAKYINDKRPTEQICADELDALLASRSTPAAPASTEALIAAGDALRKTLDALIEKWYDRLNNIYGWGESADCLQECAEELRAAVAALHPASEETKP